MKFSISKEDFLEGLGHVQNVVSTRTTLPILSNVLIEADADGLRLTTTDLDVGVSGTVSAEVSQEGRTTLPARRLAGIVRELPADQVEVIIKDDQARIECGNSKFKIIGLDANEFPPVTDLDNADEYKIHQGVLLDALKKTHYASSTDETRYVLNGIYFVFEKGKITLVATDGRRLAHVENDLEFPEGQERSFIVPSKAIAELQRLLGTEGSLRLRVSDSQVAFEVGDSLLVSKLIEGQYPDFRRVIPAETKHRVTFEREALATVVNRVKLLTSDKSASVKLSFDEDQITVLANSPDIGEAEESLVVKYKGEPMEIAFNPSFLTEPLKNLETEDVFLELIDETSPGVLRNEGNFLYVIMPMRVND